MKQVAPEVLELEVDADAHGIKIGEVLAAAEVNPTTWWRWRNDGVEPRMPTFRKVRQELNRRIEALPPHGALPDAHHDAPAAGVGSPVGAAG